MRQVREAKVPEDRASELIPRLFDDGIADPSARITRAEGFRLVPIKEERCGDAIALGLEMITGPAYSEQSRPPMERIKDILDDIPSYDLAHLPEKWEMWSP